MLSTIPPKRLALTSLLKSTSIPSVLRLLSTWVSCCYLKFDMSQNGLILYIKTVHPADILILLIPPFSQPQRIRILKPCLILSLSKPSEGFLPPSHSNSHLHLLGLDSHHLLDNSRKFFIGLSAFLLS